MINHYHTLMFTLGLLFCLSGCSIKYDFTECTENTDCLSVEGNGTFYTCDTNAKQCIVDTSIECRVAADCPTTGATCTINKCMSPIINDMDMSTPADMGDMPVDMNMGCTKNSECSANMGEGHLCNDQGACFNALTEDCTAIRFPKDGEQDNVVFIGTLLPLVEPFGAAIGTPLFNAVSFAQDQFNGEGGLPGGRKIAWISCDTKGNALVAKRAATHLVETIKVPAIIGPVFSENFISVASDVAKPNGTLAFATTATSPAITNLHTSKDDLIWRNIPSDEFQGAAFVKRIASIGVQRVLILYKDDKYGADLQAQISPQLINTLGMSNVKVAKYDNPVTIPDQMDRRLKYGTIIQQQLTEFEPQAVLILGTNEGAEVGGAYLNVSQALSQTAGKIIFSHGVVPVMAEFVKAIGESIIPLVEAVAPVIFDPTDQGYKNFALAYNLAFQNTKLSIVATTTFDAAMTIFFAMSTVSPNEQITGKNIAQGFPKLNDKENGTEIKFFVTPSYAGKARQILEMGNTIDMVGVSGALDYDLDTGSIYNRFFGWEVIKDNINGFAIVPKRQLIFTAPPATDGDWQNIP